MSDGLIVSYHQGMELPRNITLRREFSTLITDFLQVTLKQFGQNTEKLTARFNFMHNIDGDTSLAIYFLYSVVPGSWQT